MRAVDRRGFQAKEAVINGLLSRYPLTEEGYVAAAAALFWDNWPSLTDAVRARSPTSSSGSRWAITTRPSSCHWAGVRFLLDSQRSKVYERPNSKIWNHVAWSDIYLTPKEKYFVLEYRPGTRHGHRGTGNHPGRHAGTGHARAAAPPQRRVAEGDRADGLPRRAGHAGRATRASSRASAPSADSLEEQMEIVKRGKVSYLFERFVDELQIQTLFLLLRGGNLEVKAQMKYHVEKWGRARYGEKIWPHRCRTRCPPCSSA